MTPAAYRHREEIRVVGDVSQDGVPTPIDGWTITATLRRASNGGTSAGNFTVTRTGTVGEYVLTLDTAPLPAPSTVPGAAGTSYWIDVELLPPARPPVLPPRIQVRLEP